MSITERLADLKNSLGAVEEIAPAPEPPAPAPHVILIPVPKGDHNPEVEALREDFAATQAAPPSLPNTTSHRIGIPGGPTAPSLDTNKFDDVGVAKAPGPIGPRGHGMPGDAMLAEDRAAASVASELKDRSLYASTAAHDSRGEQKGTFEVTPQGNNIHGMRIPDKVDYSKPIEPAAQHGPRGAGVPKDSFHG